MYPVYFKANEEFDHLVYIVINRKQQVMLDKYKKVCLFIFFGAGRLSQLPSNSFAAGGLPATT